MAEYVTADEYVRRFGERESKLLTSEVAGGDIDSAKVEEALDAAEEEANGYIGRRYLIPLASPPLFVRGIVQVIARYNLWKNNRPDSVADDAKIARAQLKDIGDGKLAIPGATGILEQSTGGRSLAATSGDANCPIFTEESMAGFDIPAGQHIAHWRR